MELMRPLCITALCITLSGCDPFHASFEPVEAAVPYQAENIVAPPEAPQALKIMTWNVKFGGGRVDFFFDCFGDRVLMSRDEVRDHMEGIARLIREDDPDVVLLQEVDVRSKRSAFVDQLQGDRSRGIHQLAPPLGAPVAHRARGLAGSHGLAAPACAKHGQDHIAEALLVRKGVVRDDEKG